MRIRKVSASEQVCEAIQAQISSGVWKVGDKLPSESELAAKFGVNRLTVRMALQKLNALGIVETRTGSGTFVIEFDVPAPYYLSFLDMPPFHPVKQELVEQYGVDYASSADTLLGNGPFVITEYLVDQSITMVPNENYWDRESIKLDSVTIHVMDQDAAFDLMRTGELDLADIPVDVANSYLEDASLLPDHTAELFMDGAVDWFCINMSGSTTGANN